MKSEPQVKVTIKRIVDPVKAQRLADCIWAIVEGESVKKESAVKDAA